MRIIQKIKFGDKPKDIDDLANKVLSGEKTATSSLHDYYKLGLKEKSKLNDCISILDSSETEVAIVEIIKIEIVKFKDITESFAKEEGDGDLTNWTNIHQTYYSQQLAVINKELTENTELVCEWFQLVYKKG